MLIIAQCGAGCQDFSRKMGTLSYVDLEQHSVSSDLKNHAESTQPAYALLGKYALCLKQAANQ